MCVRCLKPVTPRTLDQCAITCQRKDRFTEAFCNEHNTNKILGIDCTLCKSVIIIKSVDPKSVLQTPSPNTIDTLFHYENGTVLIDMFNEIGSNANTIQHRNIINNETVIIGAGMDDPQYTPPIKKIEETDSELRVYITPPDQRIYLQPYMQHIKDDIYTQIRERNLLDPNISYKMYISCFSKYYKYNIQKVAEFGGMYHRTPADAIPAHSGALNTPYLDYVIKNIGNIQTQQQGDMQNSNWVYLGTIQVAIVFIKLLGKPVRISNFVPYKNARGRDSIINIDNQKSTNRIKNISPCVVVALRSYFLLTDTNNPDRANDFNYLTKNKCGKIDKIHWAKLRKYKVLLPKASIVTGEFNFNHWTDLEKANRVPLAIHILKSQKSTGKVNIECIRAPSQKIMQEFSPRDICHLLMLNESHVCYIPDMSKYMEKAFGFSSEKRCMFCYLTFATQTILGNHLNDGICYNNRKQPTQMILSENGFIPHQNLISETCPELILIADCEAMVVSNDSNNLHTDDDDDDDDNLECSASDNKIVSEKPSGKISTHIPHSISVMSLNHKFEMQDYRNIWGTDVAHRLLDLIEDMVTNFQEKVKKIRYPNPILTVQDNFNFMNSTHCAYCNIDYSTIPNSMKHRHHNHYLAPIYGVPVMLACGKMSYPVISGNYVNSSCATCNWKITNKRRIVNVYFHNFSNYDGPLLISGLLESRSDDLKSFNILPKGATGYHFAQYKNIRFLDSLSFLEGSLSSLVQLLCKKIDPSITDKTHALEKIMPITVKTLRESRFHNDVIPLLTSKLSYPYSLPKKIEDFENIGYLPPPKAFRDELNETDISDADYSNVKTIFEKSGCKNLRDLCDLYIMCDVSMLADVFADFNIEIFDAFGIHVANFVSGSSLSMRAGLKQSKTDIELLSDYSMYETFQNSIRGGYCAVNKRYARANNYEMGSDFKPNKKSSIIYYLDFNNLYGGCLTQKMPYGDFSYMSHDIISKYEKNPELFLEIDPEASKGYFITCDFHIPENLARLTDCMPLAIVNTKKIVPSPYTQSIGGGKASQKKLIAAHFSLERYSFHIKLLQFYIRLGVIVSKVHSIIEFSQKPLFKNFVEYCAKARRIATEKDDPVRKRVYKGVPNRLYGKTLQNDISYDGKYILVKNGDRYRKLCSNFRFKSRRWVVKDKIALVTLSKPYIKVKTPIFIGATVLQFAKLENLSFDLQVVKPSCFVFNGSYPIRQVDSAIIEQSREIIEHIYLIYCDTDSVLYYLSLTEKAKNYTHEQVIQSTFLHKYLDRSNFSTLSRESICAPCELGYLKSEVSDNIILETIALSPKCYSIESRERLNDNLNVRTVTKGIPNRISKIVFNHQTFRDTLFRDGFLPPRARANLIRRDKESGVNTIHVVKSCLSLIDNKRWWLSKFESLGYGHPDIPKNIHLCTDIVADRGAFIKDSIPTHQKLFTNNTAANPIINSNDHISYSDNEIAGQNIDGYDNYPDFFDTEMSTQNTNDYNNRSDFSGNSNCSAISNDCNNHNDDSSPDIYNDSSYHDYNLLNDTANHTIKTDHDCVNIHINSDEIICYKKCK